eukprot:UN31412
MLAIVNPNFVYTPKKLSLHQLPKYKNNELNLPININNKDTSVRQPNKDDKIVYIDGSFDLIHSGTLAALQEAKRWEAI